eukprot:25515_1
MTKSGLFIFIFSVLFIILWSIRMHWFHNDLTIKAHLNTLATTLIDNELPKISVPSHIYLLGERNSGTTFFENILTEAFSPNYTERPSRNIPIFGSKHMFRHNLLNITEINALTYNYTNILWMLAVRNPCDWVDGMYRNPWHMCNPNNISSCPIGGYIGMNVKATQNLTRKQFLDIEWGDYPETHKDHGYIYANIFELRKHKLQLMKQLKNVVSDRRIKIVKLREIESNPTQFIEEIAKEFNYHINKHFYRNRSIITHPILCLNDSEMQIAQQQLNWDIERDFGFTPLDCHTCFAQ